MVEVRFREVVIDCADPRTLAAFWASFTGYERRTWHEDWATIGTPDGSMIIGFQQVPEAKTARRWVSEDPDDPFVVLADPEGNEFCIVGER